MTSALEYLATAMAAVDGAEDKFAVTEPLPLTVPLA
jgi:hypothetical protein